MKPNPGGQLAVENIVGRDDIVAQMWRIIVDRNIYMNDLRRVGKTMILDKMKAAPPVNWLVVKKDLSECQTAAEFATEAYVDSLRAVEGKSRFTLMEELIGPQKPTVIGTVKLADGTPAPWKEVLKRTFADMEAAMKIMDSRIVFLWDEVPYLLQNISETEDARTAMQVLDTLRVLSQKYTRVRFILTGSIGLHHILAKLRIKGYTNSLLNHMEHISPGPLALGDAVYLADALLSGDGVQCDNQPLCAKAIADGVGNVAFYIHKLVSRLPKGKPIDPKVIDAVLEKEITSKSDDWDFAHYRNRLPRYYDQDEELVLRLLDAVACASAPVSFEAIRQDISSQISFQEKERLRKVLKLAEQDHYLNRDAKGLYSFRFPLIRRWWISERSLSIRSAI